MPSGRVATVTIVSIYAVSNSGPDLQMLLLQVKYFLIYLKIFIDLLVFTWGNIGLYGVLRDCKSSECPLVM